MSFNWPKNSNSACDYPRCGCVGTCEGKSRTIIQTTATDHANAPTGNAHCPCCGELGRSFPNTRDLQCTNPECDVRTFRKR